MPAKKKRPASEQPALPGTKKRHTAGTVEKAAVRDIKALAGQMPAGSDAIQSAYKSLARDIDRAERAQDGWKKATYVRELLKLRASLAPLVVAGAGDQEAGTALDAFVESLPDAAVGDGKKS